MVKGITGLGLPLVAIPVLAGFIGVERAVVLMLVPGIGLNFGLLWNYRAHTAALANLRLIVVVDRGAAGNLTHILLTQNRTGPLP